MIETSIIDFFTKSIEYCKKEKIRPILTILPSEVINGLFGVSACGAPEIILTWGSLMNLGIRDNLATFLHELGHAKQHNEKRFYDYDARAYIIDAYEVGILSLVSALIIAISFLFTPELNIEQIILSASMVIFISAISVLMMISTKLSYLKRCRQEEYEADDIVIKYGFGEVTLKHILEMEHNIEIFSTHPTPSKRKRIIIEKIMERK